MRDWAVTYRYKPNPKTTDNMIHVEFLKDTRKENIEYVLRHIVEFGEYIEILKIESVRVHDKRVIKERPYFKIPCSKHKDKLKCEWLFHNADCTCCEFAIIEADKGGE